MKNKPLTKKQRIALIDAWVALNCLCARLENPECFTKKYNPFDEARIIWRQLDSVVMDLYDEDL